MPSKADVQKSASFLSKDKPQPYGFNKIYPTGGMTET